MVEEIRQVLVLVETPSCQLWHLRASSVHRSDPFV
jgi:hypothetical protein